MVIGDSSLLGKCQSLNQNLKWTRMSNCASKKAYLLNYNSLADTTNIINYCNIEWECMVYWIQEPCDEMVSQYLPSSNPWSSPRHVFTIFSNTNLRNYFINIMHYVFFSFSKLKKIGLFYP